MTTRTAARRSIALPSALVFQQMLLALIAGVVLFFVLLAGLITAYNLLYAGRIYPGVSVAGIDLSGLHPDEAQALLSTKLTYPKQGQIAFQEGGNAWAARPEELGLFLDAQTSAKSAYQLGRQGNPFARLDSQFRAWQAGKNLPPLLVYDQRLSQAYLERIAAQVSRPTVEATLSVKGTEVLVVPGQVGRSVDYAATLAPLDAQLRSLSNGVIPVVMRETPPAILDANAQAEIARRILSAPLTLTLPDAQEGDPGPWTFDPATLAQMLTIERQVTAESAFYQVGLGSRKAG